MRRTLQEALREMWIRERADREILRSLRRRTGPKRIEIDRSHFFDTIGTDRIGTAELQARFEQHFWCEDAGFYAFTLDPEKRRSRLSRRIAVICSGAVLRGGTARNAW